MRLCLACAVSALAALAANAEWRVIEQVNEMDGTTTTSFIVRDVAPTRPLESYDGEVLASMEVIRTGRRSKCARIQLAFEFNVPPELRMNRNGLVRGRVKWDDDRPFGVDFSPSAPGPIWAQALATAVSPEADRPPHPDTGRATTGSAAWNRDGYRKLWQTNAGIRREVKDMERIMKGYQSLLVELQWQGEGDVYFRFPLGGLRELLEQSCRG